jgi:uncharacterized protein YjbJ (UPF0337 family)
MRSGQKSSPNDREVVELQPHRAVIAAHANEAMRKLRLSILNKETLMNWDQIQGDWMHFKASVSGNWVKLTDEDLTRVGGRREELAKRLQARYGFARGEAEREIDAWMKTHRRAA